jgi:hypothetical protein
MAQIMGKNASIYLGNDMVAQMVEYSINVSAEHAGEAEFGDDWDRTIGSALNSFTMTMSGLASVVDTAGQDILEAAALNGNKITDLKLFVETRANGAKYWWADYINDSANAGVFVESFNVTSPRGGVVGLEITLKGTGTLTTATHTTTTTSTSTTTTTP